MTPRVNYILIWYYRQELAFRMSGDETLDEIGKRFGTDKSSAHHNYLSFYEAYFAPRRHDPLKILEIGVFRGASLRTWESYFPHAEIIGADIDPLAQRFQRGRIRVERLDQSNIDELTRAAARHGPFDIVIDDGSHFWDHQTISLKTLFPFVRDDGFYVIEDLQTNYGAIGEQFQGLATTSCADLLKQWLDLHLAAGGLSPTLVEDPFLRAYGQAARLFAFHPRLCLIQKRRGASQVPATWERLLRERDADATYAHIGVLAHVSYVGDIYGSLGAIDLGQDIFTLQGLALGAEDDVLECRVRWPDLVWSDWVPGEKFVGTRGQGSLLTGLAVRVREPERSLYNLRVTARFVDGEPLVSAGDGEDCVSSHGAPICALQIDLKRAV